MQQTIEHVENNNHIQNMTSPYLKKDINNHFTLRAAETGGRKTGGRKMFVPPSVNLNLEFFRKTIPPLTKKSFNITTPIP